MADSKPDLARAGTMQVTAQEGQVYLEKNLTQWKKPFLMDQHAKKDGDTEGASGDAEPSKPKLSKHTTMKGTAKEAESYLDAKGKPDEDALTRHQQKKIDEIQAEKEPPAKKARMARDNTMAATAKEAKTLLGGQKLADTRQETKARGAKPGVKRASTIAKTMAEAQAIYGDLSASEGRRTRAQSRGTSKPAVKRAGTMQNTAKEGKAFLKRGKKSKQVAEEEDIEEEEENDEEEEA